MKAAAVATLCTCNARPRTERHLNNPILLKYGEPRVESRVQRDLSECAREEFRVRRVKIRRGSSSRIICITSIVNTGDDDVESVFARGKKNNVSHL